MQTPDSEPDHSEPPGVCAFIKHYISVAASGLTPDPPAAFLLVMTPASLPTQEPMEPPPTDRGWIAIAANPFSGSRSNPLLVRRLAMELERLELPTRIFWSRAMLAQALDDPQCRLACRALVAAGGDGTLSDLVNLNARWGLPISHFPLGTENLFAAHYGLPRDPAAFAAVMARGRMKTIDLATADGRLFALMLSAGFDADVAHRLAAWRHWEGGLRRVRRHSYLLPIAEALDRYHHPPIRLIADGVERTAYLALIFNIPRYGFNLPFLPHAREDDGKLDWIALMRPGFWPLLGFTRDLFLRRHLKRADVCYGRADRVELSGQNPAPIQVDGDACGFTPRVIEARPAALRVIVSQTDPS